MLSVWVPAGNADHRKPVTWQTPTSGTGGIHGTVAMGLAPSLNVSVPTGFSLQTVSTPQSSSKTAASNRRSVPYVACVTCGPAPFVPAYTPRRQPGVAIAGRIGG